MINDGVVGRIEQRRQVAFGNRHPYPIGKTLPQRAGSQLNTRRQTGFGVAGRDAPPLAELLEIIQRHVVSGEIQ